MSTIAPAVARELAGDGAPRGVAYLDCPVSGGPMGAEAGTLAVMCGGDADALALAAPALDAHRRPRAAHALRRGRPGAGGEARQQPGRGGHRGGHGRGAGRRSAGPASTRWPSRARC